MPSSREFGNFAMAGHKSRTILSVASTRWRRSPIPLNGVTFLYSACLGVLMLASPWRIIQLGGRESHVGAGLALYLGTYVVACRLMGHHQDRLGVKRMVLLGSALSSGLMTLAILAGSVRAMLVVLAVLGIPPAMFWPAMMSWLSAGQDGGRLNRRMSSFNYFWSAGLIAGSWTGGALWGAGHVVTFGTAGGLAACTFLLACSARRRHTHAPTPKHSEHVSNKRLKPFLRSSRVALLSSYLAFSGISGLLALLLKDMGLDPYFHGRIRAGQSLLMMGGFFVLGLSRRWHYSRAFLLVTQLVLAGTICTIAFCRSGWQVAFATITAATVITVCYSSSQYYGLVSSLPRAQSMSIHEMIIGVGAVLGSLGGGYLAQEAGVRTIYPVIAGVILVSVAVQAFILMRRRGEPTREA